jgi:predicted RecB family endonuclease
MTALSTVDPEIERDRYGRPMVIPPGGGKKVPYMRCTRFIKVIDDTFNLEQWDKRMVLLGLVERPDLLLSASAHRDDKKKLNQITSEAKEAAKAGAAANIGTAIHALTHRLERGEALGPVPGAYQRDLDAYLAATESLTTLHAETFLVQDELQVAGTPDRIVEFEGERYIADIKTGSIDYGAIDISMQLAVYAHSQFYDIRTGKREPLPGVNGQRGIVIHLPAGTGTCELRFVDIAAGWEDVQLAKQIHATRKRKDRWTPITSAQSMQAALEVVADAGLVDDPITARIDAASSTDELYEIWNAHQDHWLEQHTAAAASRKALLAQTA